MAHTEPVSRFLLVLVLGGVGHVLYLPEPQEERVPMLEPGTEWVPDN